MHKIIQGWIGLSTIACATVVAPVSGAAQNNGPQKEWESPAAPATRLTERDSDGATKTAPELVSEPDGVPVQSEFTIADVALKIIEEREIPSLASGLLRTSHVQEGTLVKLGDVVAEIDAEMTSLDLEKLQKEHEIAKQDAATRVELEFVRRSIEVAQADLLRATKTNQDLPGAIAKAEIDQLNLLVQKSIAEKDKTEFQITQKKLLSDVRAVEVAMGKRKLSDHTIKAPITGMVVEVFKRQGEWVEVSQSVAKVVQLDRLKAEVKIPASAALNGMLGRAAEFSPALPTLAGKTYPGKVIFVYPEANPVNASVRVWVEIENADLELMPGLMGDLKIYSTSRTETPQIDAAAIQNRPSGSPTPTPAQPLPESETETEAETDDDTAAAAVSETAVSETATQDGSASGKLP